MHAMGSAANVLNACFAARIKSAPTSLRAVIGPHDSPRRANCYGSSMTVQLCFGLAKRWLDLSSNGANHQAQAVFAGWDNRRYFGRIKPSRIGDW